jgi:hypothetical protein
MHTQTEVLEVMAGPPHVAFTWRHWAEFKGAYKGNQGDGSTVELYGFCIATVNSNLKVEELQIFYKPEDFLRVLEVCVNGFPTGFWHCFSLCLGTAAARLF